MTAVANDLENLLEKLPEEKAERLTAKVREAMSEMEERKLPSLEEIKRRRPELADLIGAWADLEFEEPEELPLPPAKIW